MPTESIQIVEVSPRDGLQNEAVILPVAARAELIERAADAGLRRIEAVSFVNPKLIPQMAQAEEVMQALKPRADVSYIGLVLNRRGLERALASGVAEINYVAVASDTFGRRNQGADIKQALATWAEVAREARQGGCRRSVTISAAFGCPFEGEVSVARVAEVVKRAAEEGPDEIVLADTIGAASPYDVKLRVEAARCAAPDVPLRCHFHNTRNTGIANAYAAIESGVWVLDASIGGVGGCPFAPSATGNIPTEDLVYMLERMRMRTGVSLPKLIETARWLEVQLARPLPAMVLKAGGFPRAVP